MYNDHEKTVMTELQFYETLANLIAKTMLEDHGIHARADTTELLKTNGAVPAITVHTEEPNISPSIHTQVAYKDYLNGTPIEDIAARMSKEVIRAMNATPPIPELTPEEAKEHIRLVVVNTEKNQQLLSQTPHYEVGDLSAIPRWYISDEASFVVNNDIAANLQLTPDEVLQIGRQNVAQQEFEIRPMKDVLKELMGMDDETFDVMFPDGPGGPNLLVITTPSKIQGAAALLDEEGTLKRVYEQLGGEYYVIMSSIHELLCMPADSGMTVEEIKSTVMEINSTVVAPQDFLSDHIQKFDGQKLSLVLDDIKMDTPSIETPKLDEQTVRYAAMAF